MALVESHSAAMDILIQYLVDSKGYIDNVSSATPDFNSYIGAIDTSDLEVYLLNKMSYTPSYMESAVQEAYNLIHSYRRDSLIRRMNRSDYFEDASLSLDNDIAFTTGLKELQKSYILGSTPQQRT